MSADEVELTVVDLLLPGTIQRAVTWMAALGRGRRKSLGALVWWSTRKMRKSLGDAEAELDVGDGNMARRTEQEVEQRDLISCARAISPSACPRLPSAWPRPPPASGAAARP
jgi:hypothetical protein